MNAISCLARSKKKKRKRNCFALIARFARERGRERQKGKKKMQGRRSDVCVQQVAISNYRIILILGFRGGWVNRRRDLRFHAYLRPTLEFFERILGVVGRREGKGGSTLSPQRAPFTRVSCLSRTRSRVLYNFHPLLSILLFSSSFSLTLVDEKRRRETAPDWFTLLLSTEKTAILFLLFFSIRSSLLFSFFLLISSAVQSQPVPGSIKKVFTRMIF